MNSNKRLSFKDIINEMRNENIAFSGAHNDLTKKLRANKIKQMELELQLHSFI